MSQTKWVYFNLGIPNCLFITLFVTFFVDILIQTITKRISRFSNDYIRLFYAQFNANSILYISLFVKRDFILRFDIVYGFLQQVHIFIQSITVGLVSIWSLLHWFLLNTWRHDNFDRLSSNCSINVEIHFVIVHVLMKFFFRTLIIQLHNSFNLDLLIYQENKI